MTTQQERGEEITTMADEAEAAVRLDADVQQAAESVGLAVAEGIVPLLQKIDQARALAARLEAENARAVAVIRDLLDTAPMKAVTWSQDQRVVDAARAFLAEQAPPPAPTL